MQLRDRAVGVYLNYYLGGELPFHHAPGFGESTGGVPKPEAVPEFVLEIVPELAPEVVVEVVPQLSLRLSSRLPVSLLEMPSFEGINSGYVLLRVDVRSSEAMSLFRFFPSLPEDSPRFLTYVFAQPSNLSAWQTRCGKVWKGSAGMCQWYMSRLEPTAGS